MRNTLSAKNNFKITPCTLSGNTLISGGAFGPEGSIQAMLFCAAAAIALLIISHKQHKIIQPNWTTFKKGRHSQN